MKCLSLLRFCPLLSWKLRRGWSTTPTSSKFHLLCQYGNDFLISCRHIDDGSKIRLWFVCFICKTLPKRLKFNEIYIYMFKVKKKNIDQVLKSVQFWTIECWLVSVVFSSIYIQKQWARGVFQERSSTFSQFTGEHSCGSMSTTQLKSNFFCLDILL